MSDTIFYSTKEELPENIEHSLNGFVVNWADSIDFLDEIFTLKDGEFFMLRINSDYCGFEGGLIKQMLEEINGNKEHTEELQELKDFAECHSIPKDYTFCSLNKVLHSLPKMESGEEYEIIVGVTNRKDAVVKARITLQETCKSELKLKYNLTDFDIKILESCYTLLLQNQQKFSIRNVCECAGISRANSTQQNKVRCSMDKLRQTLIYLDNTDVTLCFPNVKAYTINENLLMLTGEYLKLNNGNEYYTYTYAKVPEFLKYLIDSKQYTTMPIASLQIELSKTSNITTLENTLLYLMKTAKQNPKTKSCKLSFEAIFNHAGIDEKSFKTRAKNNYIKKILDKLLDTKQIQSFSIQADCIEFKKKIHAKKPKKKHENF